MKSQLVVLHGDAPLALELLRHSKVGHDLASLIRHPELDRVDFRILKAGTIYMTFDYFFIFNAQPTKACRRIELLVEYHACLLIIVVFQSQILWESLLLHLLVYEVLPLDHIVDFYQMVIVGSDHHIGLYITVF